MSDVVGNFTTPALRCFPLFFEPSHFPAFIFERDLTAGAVMPPRHQVALGKKVEPLGKYNAHCQSMSYLDDAVQELERALDECRQEGGRERFFDILRAKLLESYRNGKKKVGTKPPAKSSKGQSSNDKSDDLL